MFILQVCDFREDGDGMYRLHEPSRRLARVPGVTVVDCHFAHRLLPPLLEAADVAVLPFIHNWDFFPVIDRRRANKRATVFEANDNFYDVQPWNAVAGSWGDRSIQAEYRLYMSRCDAVQTSTDNLASLWKPLARRVEVFPNQLTNIPPLAETSPAGARALQGGAPVSQDRPLTIGWGGSPGHFADWYAVAPLLQRWLNEHPDVHLAVMTNELARPFFDLPPSRYHFTPFGPLAAYEKFLRSLDIGVAPLLPTAYNRGRSDVKYLEYAAAGVAGIYADLDPYRSTVVDGKTGLFYRTATELLQKLDLLVADERLRASIRRQAHEDVSTHRRLEQHVRRRLEFYRSLLPEAPTVAPMPAEVRAAADADGRHLRLRPGEAEQNFLSARRMAPQQAAATLAELTRAEPAYHAALLEQGRRLNDLKKHAEALAVLKRALTLDPSSAATLCEMGRSHFGRDENDAARNCMEAALHINPGFYPGWQYFLRFLQLTRSPAGPKWAAEARGAFPEDVQLSLLGARLYPPDQRIGVLAELLEKFAGGMSPDEIADAAAFSQAIVEAVAAAGTSAEAVGLLRRATDLFPNSAKLADALGRVYFRRGDIEASDACYGRAMEVRRRAAAYGAEFSQETSALHFWQFAEHVRGTASRARMEEETE